MTHYKVGDRSILPNNPNTWIPYSSTITKTIYDPCPYGYRVPINGSWTGFPANTWTRYTITGGTFWPKENGGWWPAAGYRNGSSSTIYTIGGNGYYWSSSRHISYIGRAISLGFYYDDNTISSLDNGRSHGFSVRCIEEKKINKVSFKILGTAMVGSAYELARKAAHRGVGVPQWFFYSLPIPISQIQIIIPAPISQLLTFTPYP